MDGARTVTAAGYRAAGQVAMATPHKVCALASPKNVTKVAKTVIEVPKAVITVDFRPVAADFLISLRRLLVSPRTLSTL